MAFWGLISKRERYGFTLRGYIILAGMSIVLLVLAVLYLLPFLAVTDPVAGDIMVVEGWLPRYAIATSVRDFKKEKYKLLVTIGVPFGIGSPLRRYGTSADLAASCVRSMGFDEEKLIAVSTPDVKRHRTYESAVQLKKWLRSSGLKIKALNVYTLGPHARRSRLLFMSVFAPDVEVGVVAVNSRDYEPNRWWAYSSGVRQVLDEAIAYVYAKFFFSPHESSGASP